MHFPAIIAATLLLPTSTASVWIAELKSENRRLTRQIAKRELELMEQRVQTGGRIRVAEWKPEREVTNAEMFFKFSNDQLRLTLREGRTSPEALLEQLVDRRKWENQIEEDMKRLREYEEWNEMWNRRKSGIKRPRVDPERFPEFSRVVRENLELWARKRNPGAWIP